MDDFESEKQLIASIYFDSFIEDSGTSYRVVCDPYADSTPLASARAPVQLDVAVRLEDGEACFAVAGERTVGVTDGEMSKAASLLNSTLAGGRSVFESLAVVQDWLANLPPFFLQSQSLVLPDEVVLHIFAQLRPRDLVAVAQVCRQWRKIALDPIFWTQQLLRATRHDDIAARFALLHRRAHPSARHPIPFYFDARRRAATVRAGRLHQAPLPMHTFATVTALAAAGGCSAGLLAYAATGNDSCSLAVLDAARRCPAAAVPLELDYPIDQLAWQPGGRLLFGDSDENQVVHVWRLACDPTVIDCHEEESDDGRPSVELVPAGIYVGYGQATVAGARHFYSSRLGCIAATDFEAETDSGPPRLHASNACRLSQLALCNDERSLLGLSCAPAAAVHHWDLRCAGPAPTAEIAHAFHAPRSMFVDEPRSMIGIAGSTSHLLVFDTRLYARPLFKIDSGSPLLYYTDIASLSGSTVVATVDCRAGIALARVALNRWQFDRPHSYRQTWPHQLAIGSVRAGPLPPRPPMVSGGDYLVWPSMAAAKELQIIRPKQSRSKKASSSN